MADQDDDAGPKLLRLPPVVPRGGSKWARQFGGPREVRVAGPGTVTLRNAWIDPDGGIGAADGEVAGKTVFALPAGGGVSLGQFLAGPLNLAPPEVALCGPALTARQTDVLARLGRLRDYIPVAAPMGFAGVMAAADATGCVPGAYVRPLMDRLRGPRASGGAIAILPARESERFCLANRASVAAWLRARRVEVVEPEGMRLAELAARLAGAEAVLLADAGQAGLLGLCHPGTKVLEVAPEGWLGGAARCLSAMFGLNWTPFLATAPSYTLQGGLPFGSLVACSYEIAIRALSEAMKEALLF